VKGKKGMLDRQKKQGKGVQKVLSVPSIAAQQYNIFKSMLQLATYLQHIFR
jgi:hypothetical protein